eukprot:scaffold94761_cov36-Phaeocystis_antarctica.AAC.1
MHSNSPCHRVPFECERPARACLSSCAAKTAPKTAQGRLVRAFPWQLTAALGLAFASGPDPPGRRRCASCSGLLH